MAEDFSQYPEYHVGSESPYYMPDTATSQYTKDQSRAQGSLPSAHTLNRVAPVDIYQKSFQALVTNVQARGLGIPISMVKSVFNKLGNLFYKEGYESVEATSFVAQLPSSNKPVIRQKYSEILETMFELNLVDA